MPVKKISSQSVMQKYREYQRSPWTSSLKPTLDPYCLNNYGFELAYLFEQIDQMIHKTPSMNLHTRINYRAVVVTRPDWQKERKSLEMMWRSWEV